MKDKTKLSVDQLVEMLNTNEDVDRAIIKKILKEEESKEGGETYY